MAGAGGDQRGWSGGQGSMFILYTKTSLTNRKFLLIVTFLKKQAAKKHLYFEKQLYVMP